MNWCVTWFPNIEIQILIAILAMPCFILLREQKTISAILLKSSVSFLSCLFLADLILLLVLPAEFAGKNKINILGYFLWQVFGTDALSCVYRFIGKLKKINFQSLDVDLLFKLIDVIKKIIKK
jgi:hypothetical protein